MTLSQETLSLLALIAAGLAVVALAAAVSLALRLSRLRSAYSMLDAGAGGEDIVSVVGRHVQGTRALGDQVQDLRTESSMLAHTLERAIQRVGIVRYDAFEDMGGHLSFSAALLDAAGDGIVLTAINARAESRVYAKPIDRGTSRHNLSEEEQEAIRRALGGRR